MQFRVKGSNPKPGFKKGFGSREQIERERERQIYIYIYIQNNVVAYTLNVRNRER